MPTDPRPRTEPALISRTPWEDLAPLLFDPRRWSEAPNEVEGVVRLLGLAPPARVLDLGCGPGRHVLDLARRGFEVTGVDLTESFLDEARTRAHSDDLRVELVRSDIRSFVRPGGFDAVINMSTTFGYFTDPDDDRRVLTHVRRSLRSGGALLMELLTEETIDRATPGGVWEENGVVVVAGRRVRPDRSWVDHTLTVAASTGTHAFVLSHRLYSAGALVAMLRTCGFLDVKMFGDLEGSPYDERALRLVVVARG